MTTTTSVSPDVVFDEIINMFVLFEKSFTSVDVSNEIKKRGTYLTNSVVSQKIKTDLPSVSSKANTPYNTSKINVVCAENGKTVVATLYHPSSVSPDTYGNTSLKPMTPDEFASMHNKSVPAPTPVVKVTPQPTATKVDKVKKVKVVDSTNIKTDDNANLAVADTPTVTANVKKNPFSLPADIDSLNFPKCS